MRTAKFLRVLPDNSREYAYTVNEMRDVSRHKYPRKSTLAFALFTKTKL